MKTILTATLSLFLCTGAFAQTPQAQPLYPNGAPESNGLKKEQLIDNEHRHDWASEADYFVYLPEKSKATGQAVIITPGGGYSGVAHNHEGHQVARWMNEQGIAAVILRYRMPNGHYEIPLDDVHETFRLVRKNAAKWNVDPEKIGIIGFSAGGHLAATASNYFDKETRPAFAILIYPVVSFYNGAAHPGSRQNLLGRENNNAVLIKHYSLEDQVRTDTPPTFLAHSDDDKVVFPTNSTNYYNALKEVGVAGELHIYPTGGHGWGWSDDFTYVNEFRTSLSRWLKEQNK